MPNFNTITRNLSTDDRTFARRHPILTAIFAIPSLTFAVMIAVVIGVGTAQAVGSHQGPASISTMQPATSDPATANFNDGFATAKQDDCQQGDAQACAWIAQQHAAEESLAASLAKR